MSFLKIRDPKKRDLIVNEFLKTPSYQHCKNGLQSYDDSYLQHKQQKKCALKLRIMRD